MVRVFADIKMELFIGENGEMIYRTVKEFSILVIMKLQNVSLIMDRYQTVELNIYCKMDNILKEIM